MFPKAVFAGLFRPTILDVRNPVMFISAMENLFLLYIFLQTIFRVGLSSFFSKIYREPLLMATITFSVLMAFAVGLTTSNFGSLVRYRIPLVPFFFPALYVIRYLKEKEDFENENPGLVYETAQPPIDEEEST
jgi:fatty acid desaturase